MPDDHELTIHFRPGLMPAKRHAIDDELEAALGELGEVTGGGTMMDMSESDTSLTVTDLAEGLRIIRETLRRLKVPKGTEIVQHEPEVVRHPVYEEAETAPRPERKSKWKD